VAFLEEEVVEVEEEAGNFIFNVMDNPFLIFPTLVLLYVIWEWWENELRWKLKKRFFPLQPDPPDNLRPAEIYLIVKGEFGITGREFVATILDLSQKGFLKIVEKEKDYELVKMKEFVGEELREWELSILNSMFKNKNSILLNEWCQFPIFNKKESRIKFIETFEGKVKKGLTSSNYLPKSFGKKKERIETITTLALGLFAFFALLLSYLPLVIKSLNNSPFYIESSNNFPLIDTLKKLNHSLGLCGILLLILSPLLKEGRSKEQMLIYFKSLSFVEFLKKPKHFEESVFRKYLPYIVIFDLVGTWQHKSLNQISKIRIENLEIMKTLPEFIEDVQLYFSFK
jgi:hypothetical protein